MSKSKYNRSCKKVMTEEEEILKWSINGLTNEGSNITFFKHSTVEKCKKIKQGSSVLSVTQQMTPFVPMSPAAHTCCEQQSINPSWLLESVQTTWASGYRQQDSSAPGFGEIKTPPAQNWLPLACALPVRILQSQRTSAAIRMQGRGKQELFNCMTPEVSESDS